MRISFVCSEYPPGRHGGIGTFTQVMGRALASAGHEVRVIGVYPAGDAEPARYEDRGVQVWRIPEPGGRLGWLRARRTLFRTVAAWANDGEIDLIEVPDWMGPAARWSALPVPVITRMNGSATFYARELGRSIGRTNFYLEGASLRRSDFLCSSSRYTADRTEEIFDLPRGATTVLPNPVELPGDVVPREVERSGNRVVFTGTLTEKKGVVSLVRAWAAVIAEHPRAELHLFGKDSRNANGESVQAALVSLLSEAERPSVHFHGHVTREALFDELRRAAVAVFPSLSEAFGIAVIESMVLGAPTIFSSRAAGPEVIRDGDDGLLVDPAEPAEIAAAILRILGDRALARRLSTGGRRRVHEEFAIDVQLPRNERFYRECIAAFGESAQREPAVAAFDA